METGRVFVGDDVCCVELGLGCDLIDADIADGDDQFEDGTCIEGENNPCETCDLSFYETTVYNFPDFPSTTVVGDELMTEEGALQERCCAAGVALGRDDLIQACLEDDGETEMQLELNDQNECLEREVQPMRYAQADGSPVVGYQPISSVISTQVVSNDVCCSKGCDGPEFTSLLGGCADVTETEDDVTYTPILQNGFDIFFDQCRAVVTIDVNYFLSTGDLACSLDNSVTYSTEFDDEFLIMQNCCASAVGNFLGMGGFLEVDLNPFCYTDFEITDGSEVGYNDEANDGEGECRMVDGEVQITYKDALNITQYIGPPSDVSGLTIDKRLCCLAYNEDDMINNGYDLTFACEEIPFFKEVPTYDPETETCEVETESYVYVDLDANLMYDQLVDGDYFNYDLSTTVDDSGDACCLKAAEEDDLATAQAACSSCETNEDDEFFTFDSPVCTRRFDRTVNCFT